ncbi:MAG TPA: hypothetical protein VJB88_11180, partial [Vicinamibacteria bacterium]|nr:hypothetical protein [Vicinamibacteria bacterium]
HKLRAAILPTAPVPTREAGEESADSAFRQVPGVSEPRRERDRIDLNDERSSLACQIEATQESYRVGEAIEILVTFTNRTGHSIDVPDTLSAVDGSARFQILDTSWKVLPQPTANPTSPKSIRLQPGGRVTLRLGLNAPGGYRLNQPGIYHIVLLGSPLGLPNSNTLTLRIDP